MLEIDDAFTARCGGIDRIRYGGTEDFGRGALGKTEPVQLAVLYR